MIPPSNIYPLALIMTPSSSCRPPRSRRSMLAGCCLPHVQAHLGRTLIRACQDGDYGRARQALVDGADPNCTGRDGMTPLHWAVERDDMEILQLLLQPSKYYISAANVDGKDSFQCTPLAVASEKGNWRMVDILLRYGANPNLGDTDGWTPLHWTRSPEVALRLLQHDKIDMDAVDKDGETPLHLKVGDFDLAVADVLLHHGANFHLRNSWNMTPLQTAAHLLDVPMVQRLLQGGVTAEGHECCTDPSSSSSSTSSSIWTSCPHQSRHYFLSYRDNEDQSVYFRAKNQATTQKKLALAKLLLQQGGVDPTRVHTCCGMSPLHHVCRCSCGETASSTTTQKECCQNTDMLKIVLAHVSSTETINVQTHDEEGLTPLHCICRGKGGGSKRSVEAARLLIEKGADIHAKTYHGHTPLMMACQANNVELVRFLLTKIKETTTTPLASTILSYACANSSVDIVQLLCEEFCMEINTWNGGNLHVSPPLESACAAEQLDTIFYLLRDQQALSLSLSPSLSRCR
eukprot:scaffold2591_cov168-Amphora_coffeaeformis.AAC.2